MSQTSLIHLQKKRERINKDRTRSIDKLHNRFDELCMLSLEGEKEEHREMMDKLGKTIAILWRFDRKLEHLDAALEKANE